VLDLLSKPRPAFYDYLVYDLIHTELSFKQLTLRLPFDASFTRVSTLRLHTLEYAKLRWHLKALRAATRILPQN
jgi:hypothetical protein